MHVLVVVWSSRDVTVTEDRDRNIKLHMLGKHEDIEKSANHNISWRRPSSNRIEIKIVVCFICWNCVQFWNSRAYCTCADSKWWMTWIFHIQSATTSLSTQRVCFISSIRFLINIKPTFLDKNRDFSSNFSTFSTFLHIFSISGRPSEKENTRGHRVSYCLENARRLPDTAGFDRQYIFHHPRGTVGWDRRNSGAPSNDPAKK